MNKMIPINDLMDLLPHRFPFLLVDRVLDYLEFDYLVGIKNVTVNEPFFSGHFPEQPIMPGVLILESLAQASAILYSLSKTPKEGYKFIFFFAGIDNAKFKQIVTPGDTLRLNVKITAKKRDFWRLHGEVFVEEKLVCSADLMTAAREIKRD